MADQRISQLPVADPIDGTELLAIVQAAVTKRMPISALTTIGVLSSLTVAGNTSLGGGTFVFNDAAGDYDFRVEGTTDQNLIRTDASTNNVGIGVAAPTEKLDVAGSINLATGNAIKINGTSVLNATTLGAGVVNSSLTSVGTLTSLNVSGSASLNGTTIPANSTLVTTNAAQTLTNKVIDDVSNFVGANQLHVKAKATENLVKGDVVKVTGWNAGENAIEVAKVSSTADIAFGMADSTISIGALGAIVNTGFVEGINTNSFTVGTILYPNTTGGLTSTKPSSGLYQAVAFVLRQSTNNGTVYVEFTNPQQVEASTNTANTLVLRDGSGNFSAGTITATLNGAAPAGSLTGTTLASNVVSSSLTSVGTLSSLTVSGNLTVDTNTLFVDSANDRVGVGTTSPSNPFTVSSTNTNQVRIANPSATGNALQFVDSAWSAAITHNSGVLTFNTADVTAERMRITSAGNVGIGTATPGARLDVSGSSTTAFTAIRGINSAADSTATTRLTLQSQGGDWHLDNTRTGANLTFTRNSTEVWRFNSSGHFLAGADATYDIGASGANRPRDLFLSRDITSGGNVSAVGDFRLVNSYTRVADADAGGGFGGGYNLLIDSSTARYDSTGNIAGYHYRSGGTIGFFTGGSAAAGTVAPERMTLDASGNLGIGVASPTTSGIDILRSAGNNAGVRMRDGTYDGIIGINPGLGVMLAGTFSNHPMAFYANNAERMRLDASGNLGLGVTPSAWTNNYKGIELSGAALTSNDTTSTVYLQNAYVNGGQFLYKVSAFASSYTQSAGQHIWSIAPSGTAGNAITFTQAMTLNASGFLGLGTTSISYRLDAVGGFQTVVARLLRSGDYGEVLRFGRSGVDEGASIGYPASGVLSFNTGTSGGTERARIDASGNFAVDTNTLYVDAANNRVGVGTASPQATLDVNGNGIFTVANAAYATAFNSTSGNLRIIPYVDATQGSSLISYSAGYAGLGPFSIDASAIRLYTGSTVRALLDASGNLGLGVTPSAWQSARRALQVGGSGALWANATGAGFLFLSNNVYFDGTNFVYLNTSAASIYQQATDASHRWLQAPSGTQNTTATLVETMRLDASGNLGVGTTTPTAKLHTVVASASGTDGTHGARFNAGGNVAINVGANSSVGYGWIQSANWGSGYVATAINPNGGNVGIGTASPAFLLDISGSGAPALVRINNATTGKAIMSFANAGSTAGFVGLSGSWEGDSSSDMSLIAETGYGLRFYTNGSAVEKIVIDTAGNLGLGVTPSAWGANQRAVDLGSYASVWGQAASLAAASNVYIGGSPSVYRYRNTAAATLYETGAGAHTWYTAPSGTAGTAIGFSSFMSLDASGNLGLGVTPSAWGSGWTALQLSASGAALSGRGNTSEVYLSSNAHFNGSNWIYKTSATAAYYGQDTGQHKWYIAPSGLIGDPITFTQAMLLNASGDLYLGGTSSTTVPSLSRAIYLQNATANSTIGYSMYINAGSFLRGSMFLDDANDLFGWDVTYSSASPAYAWRIATGEKMRLDVNGNLLVGTTGNIYGAANRGLIEINGSNDAVLGLKVGNAGKFYMQAFANNAYIVASGIPMQLETQTNQPIQFATNGNIRLTLDGAGRVGLGSTGSFAWHSNYQPIDFTYGTIASENAAYGQTIITCNAYNDGTSVAPTWKRKFATFASQYMQSSGEHYWFTAANGSAGTAISWTNAMTLNSNGSLALGASSATRVNSDTTLYIQGASFASVNLGVGGAYSGAGITLNDSAALLFRNVGAERARITSGGYFKASPTGSYDGPTATYHELRQDANNVSVLVTNIHNAFTSANIVSGVYGTAASASFLHINCTNSNAVSVMNVRGDGNVYNTNGTYGTISDATIKQDIVAAPSQWSDIKAIQFRKYRLKDHVAADANAPYLLGVVAQELEQVSPGLVDENSDGIKAVKSSILLMKAAVALQEAMARIESLEARLAALEAQP